MPNKTQGIALAAALVLGTWSGSAAAQEGAAFFDGQTVNYIVSTDPGGGYDTYGRLVAEYMQRHLPGSTFVVRNMPGAGNMIGANFIAASEADGLTIGTFNTGLIYSQVAGNEGLRFDMSELSWIGKAASDPRVLVVSEQSGIESFEALESLEEEVNFGTAGIGTASMVEATILFDILDLPINIITGYEGEEEQLAMMRGEVAGVLASRSSYQQWVDDGEGRFLAQIGGSDTDVPQLSEFVEDDIAQQAISLVASQGTIGRLTVGPGGIPEDRLEALRDAYEAALTDPEFLERAEALGLPIDPMIGDELRDAVLEAVNQNDTVTELLSSALGTD